MNMLNQCKYCGKVITNYGWSSHQCDEWRSYQHDRDIQSALKFERAVEDTSTNVNKQDESDNTAHTSGNNG